MGDEESVEEVLRTLCTSLPTFNVSTESFKRNACTQKAFSGFMYDKRLSHADKVLGNIRGWPNPQSRRFLWVFLVVVVGLVFFSFL